MRHAESSAAASQRCVVDGSDGPRSPAVAATAFRSAMLAAAFMLQSTAVAQTQPAALAFDSRQTLLMFMQPGDAESVIAAHRPSAIDPHSAPERAILEQCTRGEQDDGVVLKGPLSMLQSMAVRHLIATVSDRVRQEIAQYSAMFSQSAAIDFYAPQPGASSDTSRLEARHTCLRFAQADVDPSGSIDVAFDLIAGIRIAEGRDAVLVRPLRLFVGRTAVKSKDRSVGVAIGLRADAVWRDSVRGLRDTIWDDVLMTDGIDLASGPALRYPPEQRNSEIRLPLPPVSFGVNRDEPFGRLEITLTAAEVGALPTPLQLLGDMLLPSRDRGAGLLYEAAQARPGSATK